MRLALFRLAWFSLGTASAHAGASCRRLAGGLVPLPPPHFYQDNGSTRPVELMATLTPQTDKELENDPSCGIRLADSHLTRLTQRETGKGLFAGWRYKKGDYITECLPPPDRLHSRAPYAHRTTPCGSVAHQALGDITPGTRERSHHQPTWPGRSFIRRSQV